MLCSQWSHWFNITTTSSHRDTRLSRCFAVIGLTDSTSWLLLVTETRLFRVDSLQSYGGGAGGRGSESIKVMKPHGKNEEAVIVYFLLSLTKRQKHTIWWATASITIRVNISGIANLCPWLHVPTILRPNVKHFLDQRINMFLGYHNHQLKVNYKKFRAEMSVYGIQFGDGDGSRMRRLCMNWIE